MWVKIPNNLLEIGRDERKELALESKEGHYREKKCMQDIKLQKNLLCLGNVV